MNKKKLLSPHDLPERIFTIEDRDRVLKALESAMQIIKHLDIAFTCQSCDFFENNYCKHFNDAIPESYLDKGCDNWSEAIPF